MVSSKLASFAFLTSLALASASARADQAANWTCTSDSVQITGQTPYLGESSPATQTLYTIVEKFSGEFSVGQYAAFFLTVSAKTKGKTVTITGTNAKKGSFTLVIRNIVADSTDIAGISEKGDGTLTYSHGPISGSQVPVKCTLE